jgi:hypothetical protein
MVGGVEAHEASSSSHTPLPRLTRVLGVNTPRVFMHRRQTASRELNMTSALRYGPDVAEGTAIL